MGLSDSHNMGMIMLIVTLEITLMSIVINGVRILSVGFLGKLRMAMTKISHQW